MERQKSGKVIAIVALLFAVAGLSLGFAAYSTTLNITSSADVKLDSNAWKIGFSTATTAITPGTVTGTLTGAETNDNPGTLNLQQFVISQTTPATLHTTNGSKVEYNFYIVNEGDLDAYLNSITMGNLSCAYATGSQTTIDNGHTQVTPEAGATISDNDCRAMFTATLDIGNGSSTQTNGTSKATGFGDTNKLVKKNGSTLAYVPVKLTIAYTDNSYNGLANAPLSDFVVSLSDSAVVYGTSSN